MTKRRTEYVILHDSPLKRYCSSRSLDMPVESVVTDEDMRAPSLLALLGCRRRKRHYFEDEERPADVTTCLGRELCDTMKHAGNIIPLPISKKFQDGQNSCTETNKKRVREVKSDSEADFKAYDKTHEDTCPDDSTYNSFHYWRVPLPALDLSLLEDVNKVSQAKGEQTSCDSSSDAMET